MIGNKIREATINKIPYMIIVGEQEENNNIISVRSYTEGSLGTMDCEKFIKKIKLELKSNKQREYIFNIAKSIDK